MFFSDFKKRIDAMKMRLQKDKFYDTKKVARFPGNKIDQWKLSTKS